METSGAQKRIELLDVKSAKEWLNSKGESDFTLLDVRQPQEYNTGHLPGAVFIPLPELIERSGELDPAKPVVAYCRLGNRSRAAVAFLLSEGFSKVYSLDGGITAWHGEVATGSYNAGLFLLEGRETAQELISVALALEEGSRVFYLSVKELTADEDAKNIFSTIAGAEAKHKANIIEAYRRVTGQELSGGDLQNQTLKGIMEGGVKIEDAINFLKAPGKTLADMIELSMQIETNALDLYIRMLRKIENRDAEKVFEILIAEEKEHLQKLGQLLGERVR